MCIRNFENLGISNMRNLVSTTLKGICARLRNGKITDAQFRDEIRKNASGRSLTSKLTTHGHSLLVRVPEEKLNLLYELRKKYKILMLSNTNNLSFRYSEKMFELVEQDVNFELLLVVRSSRRYKTVSNIA